jgi:hypothetical protein
MFFDQLNINNAPLNLFSVIRDILTINSGSTFRGGTLPAVHGTSVAGNDTANGRMVASDDRADALILIVITPRCNASLTWTIHCNVCTTTMYLSLRNRENLYFGEH